nr:MAG TPA: hypothetical protein [Caudoviricetes sp.]DAX36583.1 MAG TPA: hypothetical protein [Caudoviricetes sp.]
MLKSLTKMPKEQLKNSSFKSFLLIYHLLIF